MHFTVAARGLLFAALCLGAKPAGAITESPHRTSSTFSIPTAATAKPRASPPTIEDGTAYIEYSTVKGFFLQDLTSTDPATFDYTATNFGLINQTYKTGPKHNPKLSQWERFNRLVFARNQEASQDVVYKLLFIGRHGEGYHNAAEAYYGTPAWNENGNSTVTWADAHLTPNGIAQANLANSFWEHQLTAQNIEPPQSYYVSPLTRCLQTAELTYSNLSLPAYYPFKPLVKEYLREGISIHTCDHRSNTTYIRRAFPNYRIDPDLTKKDEIWNGITAETPTAQDYRSKVVLDQLFSSDPSTIISITTHSGEAASLLRVLGHIPFSLSTGEIIPVFVKARTVKGKPPRTSTMPWSYSSWCTNGAPKTSMTQSPYRCVCSGGVEPVATTATVTKVPRM